MNLSSIGSGFQLYSNVIRNRCISWQRLVFAPKLTFWSKSPRKRRNAIKYQWRHAVNQFNDATGHQAAMHQSICCKPTTMTSSFYVIKSIDWIDRSTWKYTFSVTSYHLVIVSIDRKHAKTIVVDLSTLLYYYYYYYYYWKMKRRVMQAQRLNTLLNTLQENAVVGAVYRPTLDV